MMPEGWREEILGNICDIAIGGTPSRAKEEYWARHGDGNVWVSIADLNGKVWISDSKEKISQRGVEKSNVKLVTPGTVLMSFKLTIGRVARAAVPLYTNEAIAAFVPKRSSVYEGFLFHVLPSAAEGGCADVAVKGKTLNKEKLRNLQLTLPPLPEQRAIAEIVDSVDATISATEATLAQTRRVKQALLQQLLTKGIDENGHPHTKFKMTEIGEIPEAWEVCTAESICETISVGIVVKPASLYVPSGIPCFRGTNIGEGYLRSRDFVQISPEANELHRKSKLRKGDILVIRTGYPGTACVVPDEFEGANCVDLVFCRPKAARVRSDFLCTFINSDKGKLQVSGQKHGLAQQHFNVKAMNEMIVSLPQLEEQARILSPVRELQCIIADEVRRLDALNTLKRALMRDLLTGKVRVKDVKL